MVGEHSACPIWDTTPHALGRRPQVPVAPSASSGVTQVRVPDSWLGYEWMDERIAKLTRLGDIQGTGMPSQFCETLLPCKRLEVQNEQARGVVPEAAPAPFARE
jgi:hypothetical protein